MHTEHEDSSYIFRTAKPLHYASQKQIYIFILVLTMLSTTHRLHFNNGVCFQVIVFLTLSFIMVAGLVRFVVVQPWQRGK